MKRVIIVLVFLNLFQHLTFAQNKKIDSLQKETIRTDLADTQRVKLFNNLSYEYIAISEYTKALDYADKGLLLAQEINYKKGEVECYINTGRIKEYQSNYPAALQNYFSALNIYQLLKDKKGISESYENIGIIFQNLKDYNDALKNYNLSLSINKEINNKKGIASSNNNIAGILILEHNNTDALKNYFASLTISEEIKDKATIAATTENIGIIYKEQGKFEEALDYTFKSLKLNEEIEDKHAIAISYANLTDIFISQKNYLKSLLYAKKELSLAKEISANDVILDAYKNLAKIYAEQHNYELAYENCVLFKQMNDSIFNSENSKQISDLETNFAVEKKTIELKAKSEAESKKQNLIIFFVGLGLLFVLVFAGFVFRSLRVTNKQNKIIVEQKKEAEKQYNRSEELLLNILPEEVAEELKETGTAKAKEFKEVSVVFTDFKGFTIISEKMNPEELVSELHYCFSAFDKITEKYGLEKIKTIGDSFMCVAGLPRISEESAVDAVRAGIAIRNFMNKYNEEKRAQGKVPFEIRIGIHSGPVVAGIVGVKKFAYDIWGDTVNTASRVESSGEVGKVNISGTTYELVKDYFTCTYRGKIKAKNKGEIDMYFVEGKKS